MKSKYTFTSAPRAYDRDPTTAGWTKLANLLERPTGWRKRGRLDQLCNDAQTDFGAAMSHMERKDWANAIVCLEDGLENARKIAKEMET